MPQRLSDMVIDEVSLVRRGANQPALVTLFKSDYEEPEDVDKAGRPRMIPCPGADCSGKFPMGTKTCPSCGKTISYTSKGAAAFAPPSGATTTGTPLPPVTKGATSAIDGHVHTASPGASGDDADSCGTCGAPMTESSAMSDGTGSTGTGDDSQDMSKQQSSQQQSTGGNTRMDRPDELIAKTEADVMTYIEQTEADKAEADAKVEALTEEVASITVERDDAVAALQTSELGKADGSNGDPILSAIAKARPEDRPLLEAMHKSTQEAQEIAKAERAARITAEYIAKMAPIAKALATDAAALGPIMKAVDEKLAPAESAEIHRILKAAAEATRQSGIFKVQGSSGGGTTTGSSAISKLDNMAAEITKADPKMTKEAAQALVLTQNPDLYQEYLEERRNNQLVRNH
jgi:hypothetical protein